MEEHKQKVAKVKSKNGFVAAENYELRIVAKFNGVKAGEVKNTFDPLKGAEKELLEKVWEVMRSRANDLAGEEKEKRKRAIDERFQALKAQQNELLRE